MNKWIGTIASLGLAVALAGCWDDSGRDNIVQVAKDSGFNTLTAAVTKAGLTATLSDESASLTVFAPTDTAFTTLANQLGYANGDALVEALPASALASILTYHVLPSEKKAADLTSGEVDTVDTFEGAPATLSVQVSGGVSLTDADLTTAHVTTADVPASNGVLHVVDKVLIPPGVLTVVQMAQANPAFSTLVGALVSVDLQEPLSGDGPFTVFAPPNEAFDAIASVVATLTPDQLTTVLLYHVVPAQVLAADIPFGTPVDTLAGQAFTINAGTPPTITDTTDTPAAVIATDVRASNGVIHVVDKVLLPAL